VVALTQPPYGTSMPQRGRRPQHQKQTSRPLKCDFRYSPKADIVSQTGHVRKVPTAAFRVAKTRKPFSPSPAQ
jgi:hypothetical protein